MQNGFLALMGVVITGIISWMTAKLTSKTQKATAEIETSGPNWQAFTAEIRKQNEETKNELNQKIDGLQTQVTGLKTEVRSMRGKLTKAMVHISAWRRRHPDDPLVRSLPEELHDDLPFDHGPF